MQYISLYMIYIFIKVLHVDNIFYYKFNNYNFNVLIYCSYMK